MKKIWRVKPWTQEEYSKFICDLFELPEVITKEWIENLDNTDRWQEGENRSVANFFKNFGFCNRDLSKSDLSGLSCEDMMKIPFNSSTIFPSKDKMPKGFEPESVLAFGKQPMMGVKKLHERGITGEGVVVAVIDFGFQDRDHVEFDGANIEVVDLFGDTGTHFHSDGVLSNLCGQNIGVAPKAKVIYYDTYMGHGKHVDKANLKILKDILKRVKNGEKIRVVNISGPITRGEDLSKIVDNSKWQERYDQLKGPFMPIIDQLKQLGCEIVTSDVFGRDFACCDIDPLTKKLSRADWITNEEYYQSKMSVVSGGKAIAEFASKDGYKFEPRGCFSWSIPQGVGMYALALQVQSNLTWDNFVEKCRLSSSLDQSGVRTVDFEEMFFKLQKKNRENEIS